MCFHHYLSRAVVVFVVLVTIGVVVFLARLRIDVLKVLTKTVIRIDRQKFFPD